MDEYSRQVMLIETHSPTWHSVTQWATRELKLARDALEGRPSHEEAQRLRGKIDAFKALLALPDPVPIAPGQVDYL